MTKDLADELERRSKACLDMARQPSTRGDTNDATRLRAKASAYAHAAEMAISALRGEEWQGIETVVVEARDAVAFLDRVRAASSDEQIAVGQDHWNRAEAALRAVAALPTKGTDHE